MINILRYDFQNLVLIDSKTFSKQGLDFSKSYLVPESGHPLEQEQVKKRPREEEDEEERRVMMSPGVRSKVELVEEEEKKVVVTKKREEEEERRMEKREVVLQPVPSTQGWQIFQKLHAVETSLFMKVTKINFRQARHDPASAPPPPTAQPLVDQQRGAAGQRHLGDEQHQQLQLGGDQHPAEHEQAAGGKARLHL